MTDWGLILVAAGRGRRLGGSPKQFRILGDRPLWQWGLEVGMALYEAGFIREICVALPDGTPEYRLPIETAKGSKSLFFVSGGEERFSSVLNALKRITTSFVLIHDAARPFLPFNLCLRLIDAVEKSCFTKGAVPLLPVSDSVKRIPSDGKWECFSREGLFLTQTPQAFPRKELVEAIEKYQGKDEAEAWLRNGGEIVGVQGDPANFKITYEGDWRLAESIAQGRLTWRTGHGYDVHPLVLGRPLVIGGVCIDFSLGLTGHSDADVLSHAVADALLGAAGEPDIGRLFPASDPTFLGISSLVLLRESIRRVRNLGWTIQWIDATLVAQVPRLAPFLPEIQKNLQEVLQEESGLGEKEEGRFNLKVKSGERVGSVGRAECIFCHAVATLSRLICR